MNQYPEKVQIFEVGPRDGLQNEKPGFIPTKDKIRLCDMLTDAGCSHIEVTSFVNPKWVPQMADAKEVYAGIKKKPGVIYNALIPNMRGLEMAIEAGFDHVVTIMSSSESHNKNNLNMQVADSLKAIEEINRTAKQHGVKVRSYIATSFGCPFEGYIDPHKVLDIALALESFGSYEISLGDTTGMANPISAYEIPKMIKEKLTTASLAVHYHRFDGLEFANNLASLQAGITVFDGAAGGLGGCPYATGAKGNIATELLVEMFHRMGIQTGIDGEKMFAAGEFAKQLSKVSRGNTPCCG
ncbi:MAG: hydroxymethylglutaryl-CoA lyase [Eubacteriales bacterium]|jgi:hydroxymethylglutaryl-CoA lyase